MKVAADLAKLSTMLMEDTLKSLAKIDQFTMKKCAEIVQKEAKERIGSYQSEIGPFNEWEELADSTKADRVAKGYSENDPLLRTGELRDSIVYEYGQFEAVIGSKNPIARYQELGTDHIPPRPFLGPAAFAKRKKIHNMIAGAVLTSMGAPYLSWDHD